MSVDTLTRAAEQDELLEAVLHTHAALPADTPTEIYQATRRAQVIAGFMGAVLLVALEGLTYALLAFRTEPASARQVVLAADAGLVILSTTYASRPNGSIHACGAGMETVIRIVVLRPVLRETLAERVDSCWKNIESGRIAWDPAARTLLVETRDNSAAGHAVKIFAVEGDGTVRLQSTTN